MIACQVEEIADPRDVEAGDSGSSRGRASDADSGDDDVDHPDKRVGFAPEVPEEPNKVGGAGVYQRCQFLSLSLNTGFFY